MREYLEKIRSLFINMREYLEKIRCIFTDDDLSFTIEKFKLYLFTLNTEQLCIVINISGTLFILFCIISLTLIHYGN